MQHAAVRALVSASYEISQMPEQNLDGLRLATSVGALFLLAFSAGGVRAQAVEPRTPVESTVLGGRVHLQYNTSSADEDVASGFVLRRARIWAGTRINDWIDGAAQIDFSGGGATARYAFVRFSLDPAVRVSLGQFKRAFDLFELTSSSEILVVERDGAMRGAGSCAGVGGPCSYSRFTERLQLSSLDVGMLVEGELAQGRVTYLASLTNGTGGNAAEENSAKSVSARLEWHAAPFLTIGANGALHDHPDPISDGDVYAPAAALDVEVGGFDEGFHLQAGILTGENWRNPDALGKGSTFLSAQGIATYHVPLDGGRVRGIEPLARLSWGDPDTGTSGDDGLLLTPGLMLHFDGRNKLAANLDAWRPTEGETAWSLRMQAYLYF